jgi:hypothetical protein
VLEFDTSGLGGDLPVSRGVIGISVMFPGGDFVDEGLLVGDAAVEALSGEDTALGFRRIPPDRASCRALAAGTALSSDALLWMLRLSWTSTMVLAYGK